MANNINWGRAIGAGLVAGLVINGAEWLAHQMWLKDDWTAAFAALGKTPTGWTTFIPANFILGVIAVWGYRWLGDRYGPGWRTALRTGLVTWIVFWVIPMAALAPLALFPNGLLALTVLVGLADGVAGTVLGAWLYEGLKWPTAHPGIVTTGAFRHSGKRPAPRPAP